MATRGAKPRPVLVKKILAVRPARLNEAEPVAAGKAVRPPWLTGVAARIWNTHAPILEGMGVLSDADTYSLAAWCQLSAKIETEGADTMSSQKLAQWRALSNEFGLTPSARARLKVGDGGDKAEDPAAQWFTNESATGRPC